MKRIRFHQSSFPGFAAPPVTDDPQTIDFPTNLDAVQDRMDKIDPVGYAATRNAVNGAVTYLSPYLSRGFISLPAVREAVLRKAPKEKATKLLQELAWREYYQRVWQALGDGIFQDVRSPQEPVVSHGLPSSVTKASTGIHAIDASIKGLEATGYMHNHLRMYVSMLVCNVSRCHWSAGASWMYYHLLDADLASNCLSWQWVAGSFSHKKYFADQKNVDRYTGTDQKGSFLDRPYEVLGNMPVPEALKETVPAKYATDLGKIVPNEKIEIDPTLPLLIYTPYQLDAQWRKEEKANRLLLLEPKMFDRFPISEKSVRFLSALGKDNIPGLRIAAMDFADLEAGLAQGQRICFKEHPLAGHFKGERDQRDWMFPEVSGYFPSFSKYWAACNARPIG